MHLHLKKISIRRWGWPVGLWLACAPAWLAGCGEGGGPLAAPTPQPTPTPVPTPGKSVYNPEDYLTKWDAPESKLNKPGSATDPEYFRLVRADTAELIWLSSVDIVPTGTPPKNQELVGTPALYRLAGVVAPAPNQPGFAQAIRTVMNWTLNQKLDVEQDPRYPQDLNNRPLVQVYFEGRAGEHKGKKHNLNRMLIRSGYAVVDLYQATSVDVKPWLNDEQYARLNRMGLWGMNIVLQARQPPPPLPQSTAHPHRVTVRTNVVTPPTRARATTSTTRRTSTRTSTQRNSRRVAPVRGAPGSASGAPPVGAPPAAPASR